MLIKIYHNPRCSKSRKALEIIESKTSGFEVIKYLSKPLTFKEIKLLLSQLNIKPIELIRTQESIWKENYSKKKLQDDEIINAIVNYPKLMERPIVIINEKGIIARPMENLLNLFN
jgi:arsenate reductase